MFRKLSFWSNLWSCMLQFLVSESLCWDSHRLLVEFQYYFAKCKFVLLLKFVVPTCYCCKEKWTERWLTAVGVRRLSLAYLELCMYRSAGCCWKALRVTEFCCEKKSISVKTEESTFRGNSILEYLKNTRWKGKILKTEPLTRTQTWWALCTHKNGWRSWPGRYSTKVGAHY